MLWLMDRQTLQWSQQAPRSVAHFNDMYSYVNRFGIAEHWAESLLGRLESIAARLIRNKIAKRLQLSDSERFSIALFVATMFARGKYFQQSLSDWYRNVPGRTGPDPSKQDLEARAFNMWITALITMWLAPHVDRKEWMVFVSKEPDWFVTSDQPCCFRNFPTDPVQGSEEFPLISMPVSRNLGLLCVGETRRCDYLDATPNIVAYLNQRTCILADDFVVSPSTEFPGATTIQGWGPKQKKEGA